MPEELDLKDRFFLKYGRRVYEPKEVEIGDILGLVSSTDDYVSLNHVDRLHLKPSFIKGDYFPYACLKGPYFGLYISEELEPQGYKFLSLNSEHSNKRFWMPLIISKDFTPDLQKEQQEFIDEFYNKKGECKAYVINEGTYKDLGKLIPLVELPSFSFLPQSTNLEELIERVNQSEGEIKALRNAFVNLNRIFRGPSYLVPDFCRS